MGDGRAERERKRRGKGLNFTAELNSRANSGCNYNLIRIINSNSNSIHQNITQSERKMHAANERIPGDWTNQTWGSGKLEKGKKKILKFRWARGERKK